MPIEVVTIKAFLVVKASGDMRVVKKAAHLYVDEVAFPITVSIPKTWGRVQRTTIDVALPEPPEARVTVGEPELSED
ncbi:MAG: hypothetical protein Q8K63_13760 [Acidimicrobiales bacterium]|nr:hypothetical protein [Acidimicrobiales bacterium]